MIRSSDPAWVLSASKEEIETESLRHVAKLFVKAILIGLCFVPFVWPIGGN